MGCRVPGQGCQSAGRPTVSAGIGSARCGRGRVQGGSVAMGAGCAVVVGTAASIAHRGVGGEDLPPPSILCSGLGRAVVGPGVGMMPTRQGSVGAGDLDVRGVAGYPEDHVRIGPGRRVDHASYFRGVSWSRPLLRPGPRLRVDRWRARNSGRFRGVGRGGSRSGTATTVRVTTAAGRCRDRGWLRLVAPSGVFSTAVRAGGWWGCAAP